MRHAINIRRRIARWVFPEGFMQVPPADDVRGATSRDLFILRLCDQFQAATALSDWEIANRAGINNRAVVNLRLGRTMVEVTAARLMEYLREQWPAGQDFPASEFGEGSLGKVWVVPAIEKIGGWGVILDLIAASGRQRTLGGVQTWARRNGVPGYGVVLITRYGAENGIAFTDDDFTPQQLSLVEIERLRPADIPRPRTAQKRRRAA